MNSGNFAEGGDLLGGANTSFVRNVIAYRPIIDHDLDDVDSEGNFTTNPFAWQKDFSDISKEVRFIGGFWFYFIFCLEFPFFSIELTEAFLLHFDDLA